MNTKVDQIQSRKGPSYREVLKLVWPLALGMANNAIMQLTDRIFLAHESTSSLEAVLPASVLSFLFITFFMSIVAYAGTFVAQFFGAGNERGCARSLGAGLLLALASTVFLVALVPVGHLIFDWCGHSSAVLTREKSYYTVVTLGGVFLCGTMAAQGYFTGRGLTRTVFWVNVLGNVLNVALDPLLIFGYGPFPQLGIVGAAGATVFAQAVQFVVLTALAVRLVRRVARIPVSPSADATDDLRFGRLLVRILRFGVPSAIYSVLNMLSFTIFVFVTGKVGDLAFAVSNAVFTINYLLFAPMEGFGIGAGTLVGQYQGRGDAEGARRAVKRTIILAEGSLVVAAGLVLAFYRPILGLFAADVVPADVPQFLSLGFTLLLLMSAWLFTDGADIILSGALKGAGDTRFVMIWMLVCSGFWLGLVGLVYAVHPTMPALWATMVVYVLVICVGTVWRWVRGRWASIRLVG